MADALDRRLEHAQPLQRAAVPRAHDDEADVVDSDLSAVNAALLHTAVAEEDDVAFVQVSLSDAGKSVSHRVNGEISRS